LRAIFNAMLGEVPGKAGPLDTATRMAKDADLAYRRQLTSLGLSASPDRDDEHLVKPVGALADVGLLEELIRIVNEAQERDAEDERRLYGPKDPRGPLIPTTAAIIRRDMDRISIGLSFLSALSALIAARHWRAASQTYGKIDRVWLDRSGDIPDFIWATAALGSIWYGAQTGLPRVDW
jgi:hypothetical protein